MMFLSSLAVFALPLFTFALPVPVPVEERRSLFLNLPLHKRLLLFKRGLFSDALKFSDLGSPVDLGVAVANVLKGPEQACTNAKQLFTALGEGESVGGTDTIGDRAVAGMRRMLGTTGPDDTMQNILKGDLDQAHITALQTLVANPDKTLASLQSYKYLLDTQSTLNATVANVNAIGGSARIRKTVLDTLLPIMQQMEATIDKIGDDFSAQKFVPADQDELLLLVSNSSSSIDGLQALNDSFASSTTAAIQEVQDSFKSLASSIKTAAGIPITPFPSGAAVPCSK